jgi:deoxyribose-phosphate aldolase
MPSNEAIVYEELLRKFEYHMLAPNISERETITGCKLAVKYGLPSVCVKPCYAHQAVSTLRGTNTKAACFLGSSFGDEITAVKIIGAKRALTEGIKELNLVSNPGYLIDGNEKLFQEELNAICGLGRMNGAQVAVILNCSYLEEELIIKAIRLALDAGADWISPSSGIEVGDDDEIFLPIIQQAGVQKDAIKVLGSDGRIKTYQLLHEAGYTRLGTHDLPGVLKAIDKE